MTSEISRKGSSRPRVRTAFLTLFAVTAIALVAIGGGVASAKGVTAHAASFAPKSKFTDKVSIKSWGSGKPSATVTVTAKKPSTLTNVWVVTPTGSTWAAKKFKKDVTVSGHKVSFTRSGRSLRIRLKTAAAKITVKIKKGAITVSHKAEASKAHKFKILTAEKNPKSGSSSATSGSGAGSSAGAPSAPGAPGTPGATGVAGPNGVGTDLVTTLTDLVGGLQGLGNSSGNPLTGLTGLLGETVDNLGATVASLGDVTPANSNTEADLENASGELQQLLTDLASGNTAGIENDINALTSNLPGLLNAVQDDGALAPLADPLSSLVSELVGTGGVGGLFEALEGNTAGLPAVGTVLPTVLNDLENTLTTLPTDISSLGSGSPLTSLLTALGAGTLPDLGTTITDLGAQLGSLTSTNGLSELQQLASAGGIPGESAVTNLLSDLQTLPTALESGNPTVITSDVQSAVTQLLSALGSAAPGNTALTSALQTVLSDIASGNPTQALTALESVASTSGLSSIPGASNLTSLAGTLESLLGSLGTVGTSGGSSPLSGLTGLLGGLQDTLSTVLADGSSDGGLTGLLSDLGL